VSVLVDNEEENAVFLQLHISGLGIGKAFVKSKPGDKAGNQLGTPVGSKGFSERGPKFLKLCPIVAQLCPTHFSRGEKKFQGWVLAPLVTALDRGVSEHRRTTACRAFFEIIY